MGTVKRLEFLRSTLPAVALLTAMISLNGCKKAPSEAAAESAAPPAEAAAAAENAEPTSTPTPTPTPEPTPEETANRDARVMVLCYHNIEDKKSGALTISTEQFEKEMQALKDEGFSVIPMRDFLAWRRGEKAIPEKSAIITIDDGWVSGYEQAWPILKKFDYPFTLFIYINYVGTGGKSMSWSQLAEMRDAGVDIECHSYSHSNLRIPGGGVDRRTKALVKKDVEELGREGWLRKEIIGSKEVLEDKLGIRVSVLAYPFGIYNDEARKMVKEGGYEAAFTVYGQQLRFDSPFDLLGRYAVDEKKPEIFQAALKMVGGGVVSDSYAKTAAPDVAQLASASMVTQPQDGETIADEKPEIKANLATMGEIDPKSIQMRISGIGIVPAKYDAKTGIVSYQFSQKLRPKTYTVILGATDKGGRKVETRWSFTFDRNAKPAAEAPLPPRNKQS